jgi:hypothetical protein
VARVSREARRAVCCVSSSVMVLLQGVVVGRKKADLYMRQK